MAEEEPVITADPHCPTCHGDGWDAAWDTMCQCLLSEDPTAVEPVARCLTVHEQLALHRTLTRMLVACGDGAATYHSDRLVARAAEGRMPPTVGHLAGYIGAGVDAARGAWEALRVAIQTNYDARSMGAEWETL